jgi:hypothetical protein
MKICWLMGWATRETLFRSNVRETFPDAAHTFVPATPDFFSRLKKEADTCDWIAGYSLGALLLLREMERVSQLGRIALLAPIFAFAREEQSGGRIARTQITFLARWLRRDRDAALADFYLRAGLEDANEAKAEMSLDDLLWGLDRLANDRGALTLPEGWLAWCGEHDLLLDAAQLHALLPAVRVVPGATHHPRELLRAMAEEVK